MDSCQRELLWLSTFQKARRGLEQSRYSWGEGFGSKEKEDSQLKFIIPYKKVFLSLKNAFPDT